MTIKKALQRSYYLMALLPILFFIFTIVVFNLFMSDHAITKAERLEKLPLFLSAIVLLMFIIMAVNLMITRNQITRITKPLALLEESTQMIIDGDLSTPIIYEENDEFQHVFQTFDAMRKQLATSIDARTQLENNRSAFLRGITHDILTPVTIIKGYVEALQDNIAKTPEKQSKYLSIIGEKTKLIEQLVEKMTIINQFQSHHYPFHFQVYSIHSIFENIFQTLQQDYSNIQISYNNTLPNTSHTNIDVNELRRVFINFVENSIKYAHASSLHISIQTTHTHDAYHIIFADNGIGIPKSQLPFIFDPFFRGDIARTNTKNGSGLGLAICQQIIQAHGGTIDADSQNGLSLHITLPIVQEETE